MQSLTKILILTLVCLIGSTFAQSRLFTGQKSLRCTNYGDPHIFPFQGDMQTCSLCGTHTLVKNDWIFATASVEYVNMTFSRATFVSKINIAFFNQDGLLVSTFGSEDIERGCDSFTGYIGSGDHIRAYVSRNTGTAYLYYKQTKINVFIRKNRFGYSFGIYLPETMITHSNGICVTGCPSDQVLKIETMDNPVVQARIPAATELCRKNFFDLNSNDPHLESRIKACIFDVAITGDDSLASEHILEIVDEKVTADEQHQMKKRALDRDLERQRRIQVPREEDILNREEQNPPIIQDTFERRRSQILPITTFAPISEVNVEEFVAPDVAIPSLQTTRRMSFDGVFNRRVQSRLNTPEAVIVEQRPEETIQQQQTDQALRPVQRPNRRPTVKPVQIQEVEPVQEPSIRLPPVREPIQNQDERVSVDLPIQRPNRRPTVKPVQIQEVEPVQEPSIRLPPVREPIQTQEERVFAEVSPTVDQPIQRPTRRPLIKPIQEEVILPETSPDSKVIKPAQDTVPPRRPFGRRPTTVQPTTTTTPAPLTEKEEQSKQPQLIDRPFPSDNRRPVTPPGTSSALSMIDNDGKICIPIDCMSTNLGGKTPRFAYPGKEIYFFECSADGVIQTRRCPVNSIFDGSSCVPQEF